MTCGIYKLAFKGTDKVYIGQSKDIEKRFREHTHSFLNRKCSKKMLFAIDTYGIPQLSILYCAKLLEEDLSIIEHQYILEYNSVTEGFNTMYSSCNSNLEITSIHGNSSYSEDTIIYVLELIVSDSLYTLDEIEKISGVKLSTIQQISACNTHTWLKYVCPDSYTKLESIYRSNRVLLRNTTKSTPGTNHAYSKEQYKQVLEIAVSNTDKITAAKIISDITSVKIDVIRDILSMRRHKWLAQECPDNYQKLKQLRKK